MVKYLKNLPEPEAQILKATFVYKDNSFNLVCNIYDFLGCETNECALELCDLYLKKYVENVCREVIAIENIKGGKIFIYNLDNDVACLCIHRFDVNCIDICRNYLRIKLK